MTKPATPASNCCRACVYFNERWCNLHDVFVPVDDMWCSWFTSTPEIHNPCAPAESGGSREKGESDETRG